jgi:uncharacterized protein
MKRWDPGDPVIVREVWQGRVWTVRPPIVVRDERELVALYMPDGCPWLRPVDESGFYLRMPGSDWSLKEERLNIHHLSLTIPHEPHSVILMWEADWKLRCWYINLEEPIRRTTIGFDFMDQTLDIVISPDMTAWRWKDEDEFEEGIKKGLYSREQELPIRAEGERALERLLAREPPFDERWEDWRPEPTWAMPTIGDAGTSPKN